MQELIATESADFADYHQLAAQRAAQPAKPAERPRRHLLSRWAGCLAGRMNGRWVEGGGCWVEQ